MIAKENGACVKISDEHGNIYLFKPYPPYCVGTKDPTYTWREFKDIENDYFILKKLYEYLKDKQ